MTSSPVIELAAAFAKNRSVLFIGRHVGLPSRTRRRLEAEGAGLYPRRRLRRRVS